MHNYIKICCFLCLGIFFQTRLHAQNLTVATQQSVCSGTSCSATVTAFPLGSSYFNWSSTPVALSFSTAPTGSLSAFTFSACGIHSLVCSAYDLNNNLLGSTSLTILVVCSSVSIVPISQTICPNTSATLSASGASSYLWSNGSTSSSVIVSPAVSSSYSVYGNSDLCPARGNVAIFDVTLTASSVSLCPSTQVTLSAVGATNLFWYAPPNSQIASGVSSVVVSPTAVPISYSVLGTFGTSCLSFKNIMLDLFPLTVSATVPSSVCSGATFSLQGQAATSYTWANAAQTLTTNPFVTSQNILSTYTLNVDSANCRASKIFTIGIFPQPTVTISSPQTTICGNQIANLYSSGALNYTWTNHSSMLSSLFGSSVMVGPFVNTTYTVLGANVHGCTSSAQHTVIVGIYPLISAQLTRTSVCPGFTAGITANGANSYTWTGNPLTNPLYTPTVAVGAGTYSLLGSNGGGCRDSLLVIIAQDAPLTILANASSSITCIQKNGVINPVYFSASGSANYIWNPYIPGQMTFSLGPVTAVTPSSSTCYTVTGYNAECSGTAVLCVQSEYCNGVKDDVFKGMRVFPNPFENLIFIESDNRANFEIEIMDCNGSLVYVSELSGENGSISINLEHLTPAIYYLQIIKASGLRKVYKVLKR